MNIYLPIVLGIYRHQILGAYQDIDEAETIARHFLEDEHDQYHDVVIVTMSLDQKGELDSNIMESKKNKIINERNK